MEVLLLKEEDQGRLHEIKVDRNAPAIFHLMHVDNLIISCRANPLDAATVGECLSKFCNWSGQLINEGKSNIFFSKSTPRQDGKDIKRIVGFKDMGSMAIYLDNSFIFGRNKSKEFHFFKERIKRRLEGWNKHLLLKVGKATLIKSMVQEIPCYTMSTFLLPSSLCEDLDAIVRKFWWETKPNASGFFPLKAWKDLCKPKEMGGLGFRRFKDMNLALVAKLGWKLASDEECLWTRLMKAKYMRNETFFGCKHKTEASWISEETPGCQVLISKAQLQRRKHISLDGEKSLIFGMRGTNSGEDKRLSKSALRIPLVPFYRCHGLGFAVETNSSGKGIRQGSFLLRVVLIFWLQMNILKEETSGEIFGILRFMNTSKSFFGE
ncbi:hypothetical protein FEM48_Zijuj02G0103000 [Ziziphus jujuba var. spinosa]|uniref:Reverse transcriptase n=1 Tax=Ziziphus jujuba var. spinosa TaxID=714518 RepID=A0A978VV64_ZIZJJ|nr:hypothetical protein FEM48_Zijuj02G0103000 [Ziziphus jujuba var. spinosa]